MASDSAIRAAVALPASQGALIASIGGRVDVVEERLYQALDSIRIAKDSARMARLKRIAELPAGVVAIQDFSESNFHLESFYNALDEAGSRPVRIAVLGDSFIEGDIMTVDLREMFQNEYSGAGVGFAPVTSQVAKFRGSLKHNFDNSQWAQHSIVKESSRKDYMLSGHTFIPKAEGSWVEYEGSKYRKHLGQFGKATFLFVNRGNTRIKVTINDSRIEEFTPEASEQLQSVSVSDTIRKVRFEVSNIDGFTAYGAMLDGQNGVSVDNYSIRGNSGITMGSINKDICAQMSRIAPYDLIVLEYGLNVASQEVTNYAHYKGQMLAVIAHIRECYPGVPVVVMGVSDRATMEAGEFVTMQGVVAMDRAQRDLAKQSKVAFWSALDAMRSMGGMAKFVENGWAAKDYTHLGARGGQKIAQKFYEAIKSGR